MKYIVFVIQFASRKYLHFFVEVSKQIVAFVVTGVLIIAVAKFCCFGIEKTGVL